MFRARGSRRSMEPAPEIDRVEWLSSSPEAVLVRVHAHRAQPRSEEDVKLIVDDGGRRRAFPPDRGLHVDYHSGAWAASFTIPIELRPRLEENLALEVAGVVLALPGALAGPGEGGGPSVDAQVIDRGVLAERRARRAELAEQALLRRATEAEATVDTLQRQLTNLEQRFAQTNQELDRLRRLVSDGDAERRRLRQREYAEQQQRLETEERVGELQAQIAGESEGLRASLREAEMKTERLAGELERMQRALAEAQHAAAAEEANVRRAREELAAREAELLEREQAAPASAAGGDPRQRVFVRVDSTEERVEALGAQLRSISDHLARREVALEEAIAAEREARDELGLERARHDDDLTALQRRVEELRGDLATVIRLVRNELQAEHAARVLAETDLVAEREAAERMSEELERARAAATGTALDLGDLPLERPTDATDAALRRQREEMAEALAAAVARLRARVAEFEQVEPTPGPSSDEGAAAPPPGGSPAGASATVPWTAEDAGDATPSAPGSSRPAAPGGRRRGHGVIPAGCAGRGRVDRPGAAGDLPAEAPPDAVELPRRLQGVRPRPSQWLAGALRRAAVHRDAQLVGELIAELLPVQGLVVRRALTYGVTIDDVGCYRVATTGRRPASVARVDPAALQGLDFEVRGSVAEIGRFVAGRGSWRLRGLRVTPGRARRARRVAHARRSPLTLRELAGANVRVWPGLLLPVLAEAIDPQWTAGERFLVAFSISGATPTVLYVGVSDGAPITVSPRRLDAVPAATLYLSERACLNLLARTPLPAGEHVLCAGQRAQAERLLDWMDRAQGHAAPAA